MNAHAGKFARSLFATACCLGLLVPARAGTWWVDAASTAAEPDGSETAPFKTIQEGVDAAERSGDDALVVKVRPGVYDSGAKTESFGGTSSRVCIKKRMTLESTDGKAKTVIVGQPGSGAYGLGDDAVRCVCADGADAADTVIVGFTFRNGGTPNNTSSPRKEGGGAVCYNGESGFVVVKDSTAESCQAGYGGAFKGVTLIRSLVKGCHNNNAGSRGSALYGCRAYCCVFVENGNTASNNEYVLAGDGPYVNCTVIGSNGCLCRSSANQRTYNVISILATRQEFDGTNTGGDYVIATASNGSGGFAHFQSLSLNDAATCTLLVSTYGGDYRPVRGGAADGFGDPQYCSLDWIPDGDRNRDFLGNVFDINGSAGSIACGAVQDVVDVQSGMVKFPRIVQTAAATTVSVSYAVQAVTWPGQLRIATDAFALTFDKSIPPRFPTAKGEVCLTVPPKGVVVTATEVMPTATLAVGAGETYATIQEAVDAAGSDAADYTVITVAPGTYGPVSVGAKNVFVRSTGGKAETFIRGVKDTTNPDYGGCGPSARQCVTVDSGTQIVCFEGFTLTNGATQVWNAEAGDVQGEWSGGGFNANGSSSMSLNQLCDCTVEDCVGWKGAAVWGGWLQRCVITRCTGPSQDYADSVVRAARMSSCVMTECRCKGNQLLTAGTTAAACTIVARQDGVNQPVASKTSYLHGTIVCGGRHEKTTTVTGSVFYDFVGTMEVTGGFVAAHALVANTFDGPFGVLAGSPAIGCWDLGESDAWRYLVDDFDGRFVEIVDGRVTAGAVHARYVPCERTLDASLPLAETMRAACCGDVIRVPAGEYATGLMPTEHAWFGDKLTEFSVGARVSVPAMATLEGAGAATTTIRGGEKIRCALLATNAVLRGFTLVGGACETEPKKGQNGQAGGVLADRSAVVEDCVIAENCAYQHGAVCGGVFRRCTFSRNRANDTSVGSVWTLENCLATGNSGVPIVNDYVRIANCTFLFDNTNGNVRITTFGTYQPGACICNSALILAPTQVDAPVPALVNCLLPKLSGCSWRWKPESTSGCLLSETTVDTAWNGVPTADFVGVDRGDNASVPDGTDLVGVPRVQNATVDIGAREFDWRPTYSAAFSRRGWADVVETSGQVTSAPDGIAFGADVALAAVVKADPGKPVAVVAAVDAGTLVVKVNGETRGALTAEANRLSLGELSVGDRIELAFADSTGEALLAGLRGDTGVILLVR